MSTYFTYLRLRIIHIKLQPLMHNTPRRVHYFKSRGGEAILFFHITKWRTSTNPQKNRIPSGLHDPEETSPWMYIFSPRTTPSQTHTYTDSVSREASTKQTTNTFGRLRRPATWSWIQEGGLKNGLTYRTLKIHQSTSLRLTELMFDLLSYLCQLDNRSGTHSAPCASCLSLSSHRLNGLWRKLPVWGPRDAIWRTEQNFIALPASNWNTSSKVDVHELTHRVQKVNH